jgi:hypothetical protein
MCGTINANLVSILSAGGTAKVAAEGAASVADSVVGSTHIVKMFLGMR